MEKSFESMFLCENIQDVSCEEEDGFGHVFWIHFGYGNCRYQISVRSMWAHQHHTVYHEREMDMNRCPFCVGHSSVCDGLGKRSKDIIESLLKRPNVRLRWLFNESNDTQ